MGDRSTDAVGWLRGQRRRDAVATVGSLLEVIKMSFWRWCGPETFRFRPRESLVRTMGSQAETRAVGDLHG